LHGDVVSTDESLLLQRKATPMDVIVTAVPLMQDETVQGAMVFCRDITPGVLLNRTLKEREEILRGIFYILPSGIMLLGSEGTILRINESARQLLGLGDVELRGERYPARKWNATNLHGDEILLADAPFYEALRTGEPVLDRVTCVGIPPDDRFVLISASPLNLSAADEATRMIVTTITDINQQLKAQNRLETAVLLNGQINNLLKNLLTETVPEETIDTALRGVCHLMGADMALLGILDDDKRQETFDHIFGFPEIFRGHSRPFAGSVMETMTELKRPVIIEDYASHPRRIDACVRGGAMTFLGAPIMADADPVGSVLLFRETKRPFTSHDSESLMALTPVLSAALYKATYERKLRELATNDPLTGIWNRRVFFEYLEMEIERSRRYGTPLSILIIDLDHFKEVNDTYGHQAGDAVLLGFSIMLKRNTRRTDMVGRTGGEEFMAILPDTGIAGAVRTAEKIRKDFEESPVRYKNDTIVTTVSVGCAEYQRAEPFDEFYGRVDRLLYRAKNGGRNQVAFEEND